MHGELDLADALDLEDAVATGAAQLAALGSRATLDVRRAAAVGIVARGEQVLELPHGHTYLRDHTGTTDLTPPPVEGPITPSHPPDE